MGPLLVSFSGPGEPRRRYWEIPLKTPSSEPCPSYVPYDEVAKSSGADRRVSELHEQTLRAFVSGQVQAEWEDR